MTFTPRTWVVGEVVSAALMNQEIRDQWNTVLGAWTTYTPTWTASTTNPVLGNGSLIGRYMKIGRIVLAEIYLNFGSTTTYGAGTYLFSAPATMANSGVEALGTARLSAGSVYIGQCILASGASTMNVTFPQSATPAAGANMTPSAPATLAAGHTLRMTLWYEAAS
ncbi:hypothetical protein ACF09I_34610 [Streptomyces sp. NPDC014940]|uniref:hypothetical protein n=1 Tax=Streptomyces sp. NPDC014940 TaxID=3364932 RepID=UPI0036F95ADF